MASRAVSTPEQTHGQACAGQRMTLASRTSRAISNPLRNEISPIPVWPNVLAVSLEHEIQTRNPLILNICIYHQVICVSF
ncbi:hypothetical protein RRG08_039180 [Elysia crispata]|uniref:Uncharacterized protein n=1 Tax=Elysia crispata TaxID=231223 RepID=A0AAE0ZDC5_9GAST|nr:hypothetical protein RRG08_039180 [Elysia crispata]